ncbi:MAG: asparaginase [Pseudomonadota bacterium]
MTDPVVMAEVWRGPFLESAHRGHAVVCDEAGQIVEAWGDPDLVVLPRSSAKMIQALPLIETGAADAAKLGSEQLALACASHVGAAIHTDRVQKWLDDMQFTDAHLRCGAHMPKDKTARVALIKSDSEPCQYHNNCSGKHAGFLTLGRHLEAGPEYLEIDHPVQIMVKDAFERITGMDAPGYGIDGCSAPNFATTMHGMARAMAHFAAAPASSPEHRLVTAMVAHPELVAGERSACTRLMRAMDGRAAVKTGAEGYYVAIIPGRKLGVALKIVDGATRASECAIAAILVRLGILDSRHPDAMAYTNGSIRNWREIETGHLRAAPALI